MYSILLRIRVNESPPGPKHTAVFYCMHALMCYKITQNTKCDIYLYSTGERDMEPPFIASVGGGGSGT